MDFQIKFAREGAASAMRPALAYVALRVFAKLLTALVPTSAVLALLGALIWLAAAIFLFFAVTWHRDDNWLGAGLIFGVSLLCGGLLADFCSRFVETWSLGEASMALMSALIGLLIRTIVLVPLSGGFVFGARWLTTEIRRSAPT